MLLIFFRCPLLHRTAGDTERRYHLRYYKTCMCVHDTDARGYCVKNGPHCAFAHGSHDMRPPVYDQRELQVSVKLFYTKCFVYLNRLTCPQNIELSFKAIF
jgi:hypothetical protein